MASTIYNSHKFLWMLIAFIPFQWAFCGAYGPNSENTFFRKLSPQKKYGLIIIRRDFWDADPNMHFLNFYRNPHDQQARAYLNTSGVYLGEKKICRWTFFAKFYSTETQQEEYFPVNKLREGGHLGHDERVLICDDDSYPFLSIDNGEYRIEQVFEIEKILDNGQVAVNFAGETLYANSNNSKAFVILPSMEEEQQKIEKNRRDQYDKWINSPNFRSFSKQLKKCLDSRKKDCWVDKIIPEHLEMFQVSDQFNCIPFAKPGDLRLSKDLFSECAAHNQELRAALSICLNFQSYNDTDARTSLTYKDKETHSEISSQLITIRDKIGHCELQEYKGNWYLRYIR